jgi:hypothetical protein
LKENDSTDNTRQELLAWADKNKNVTILGCGTNAPSCKMSWPKTIGHPHDFTRIKKMATLRNLYIDYVKENLSDYDWLLVWDMDIIASFYKDGLLNTMNYFSKDEDHNIDGICAYGVNNDWLLGFQDYDMFAHKELTPQWLEGK